MDDRERLSVLMVAASSEESEEGTPKFMGL